MDDALDRARSLRYYHTIELTPEYTTPGWFDLRPYVAHYGLPESLTGLRVLDVGTWDGFWAFEMERRGAEVVALDLDDERELDWPPRHRPAQYNVAGPRGQGFAAAREVLGSKVERVVRSIYFATPETLGQFDLVFCGSVLIHLRDQFLALERIANLVKPGGMFISAEEHDRVADRLPWTMSRYRADRMKAVVYWMPAMKTWRQMMLDAGFDRVERNGRFTMVVGEGDARFKVPHVVHHAFKSG
jgi:tRNA (mo5U34)-methyltransferase